MLKPEAEVGMKKKEIVRKSMLIETGGGFARIKLKIAGEDVTDSAEG